MGIDLYRVSERDKIEWNNTECVFGDPKSILPLLLNRSSGAQWQVLSLVDPYKNTFIEYRHVGTLLKEFRLLEEYCPSAEERNWLLQAIAFVQELDESKPHVMFVGD